MKTQDMQTITLSGVRRKKRKHSKIDHGYRLIKLYYNNYNRCGIFYRNQGSLADRKLSRNAGNLAVSIIQIGPFALKYTIIENISKVK